MAKNADGSTTDTGSLDPLTGADGTAEAQSKAKADARAGDTVETLAEKVDQVQATADNTSTPVVPAVGTPPLATEPVGSTEAQVTGEQPGDDWVQIVFTGATAGSQAFDGTPNILPPPSSVVQDQQVDQNAPSGRTYHFRQGVVTLVHPDDAGFFKDHKALGFAAPDDTQEVS